MQQMRQNLLPSLVRLSLRTSGNGHNLDHEQHNHHHDCHGDRHCIDRTEDVPVVGCDCHCESVTVDDAGENFDYEIDRGYEH